MDQSKIYKKAYFSIALLIINVIVFLLSSTAFGWMYDKGAMVTERVIGQGEFYRIYTSMFLHADINHLLNNMIIMVLAGAVVENYAGHVFYLILYFMAGTCGALLSMAYEIRKELAWSSIGASGAVMGIVGFLVVWIILNRKQMGRGRWNRMRLIFLALFVLESCFFQKGANTQAHLGGFAAGFVLGVIDIIVLKNNKQMEGLA